MTPVAWILALIFPACGTTGAAGVPPPAPDLLHLQRPRSPNTALAAPAGFTPKPDVTTPVYPMPPARLLETLAKVAAAQPRVFVQRQAPERIDWVERTAIANFPDQISAQATPDGPDRSTLILYSRSIYGYGDFGVNRKRVDAWLAALNAATGAP